MEEGTFECGPFEWVELLRLSAEVPWLKMMRWEVSFRHSSGVAPLNCAPEALRFSSVDEEKGGAGAARGERDGGGESGQQTGEQRGAEAAGRGENRIHGVG